MKLWDKFICVDNPNMLPVIQFLCMCAVVCNLDAEFTITLNKNLFLQKYA